MTVPTPEYARQLRRRWRERVGYQLGVRRQWTTSERRLAVEIRSRGKSCRQIALRLTGRTPDAVAAHLRALKHEASRK